MSADSLSEIVEKIRLRTPARLLAGRSGGAYRTSTQLELRTAHAAARDAVRTELSLEQHLGTNLIAQFGIFEAASKSSSKDEYLLRPDLGRCLCSDSRDKIVRQCLCAPDLQIVVGDGLSTTSIATQVPALLPLIVEGALKRGWVLGQIFAVRFCRVGILNDIGELLQPKVAVLLIGERPGLATAESLSAYIAFRPRKGHTDADRNLISNVHERGTRVKEASVRILNLAAQMMRLETSGVRVREELPDGVAGHLNSSG